MEPVHNQPTTLSLKQIISDTLPSAAGVEKTEENYNQLFRLELGFFEVLKIISRRTKIFLTLPETLIFGFGFPQPTLICTDYETGELHIRESITKPGITEACVYFDEVTKLRGTLPIAVHKLAATTYCKDTCKPLFTPTEACNAWNKCIAQSRAQVMQRFIMGGGASHSCLIKAIWQGDKVVKQVFTNLTPVFKPTRLLDPLKKRQKPVEMAAEQQRSTFLVLCKSDAVTATELRVSHVIDSKVMYLITLLEKYYLPPALKVASLEVDFMQDERGFSYLISLKNFKLVKNLGYAPEAPLRKKPTRLRITATNYASVESSPRHSQSLPVEQQQQQRLPPIRHWSKAIHKQREIVSLMEARERAKLNKSSIF